MQTNTSRRAFMAGSAVAAVAVTLPAVAIAAPADRRAWEFAMANYQRVLAEEAAFNAIYDPAWEVSDREASSVPHVTLRPDPYAGRSEPVSTSDIWYVRLARHELGIIDSGKVHYNPIPALLEHIQLLRDVVRADDERNAAQQVIRDRYGMDALDGQSDDLGDRLAESAEAVLETPAPDLAALRWKLDYLSHGGHSFAAWAEDYTRQTFADIARLLPQGR